MLVALQVVNGIAGLVGFICFVIVVIKMFQNKQVGLGIASIVVCFLGWLIALIVGWKNKDAWQLSKVMPIFTLATILSFGTGIAVSVLAFKEVAQERKDISSEFGDDMQMPEISIESDNPSDNEPTTGDVPAGLK